MRTIDVAYQMDVKGARVHKAHNLGNFFLIGSNFKDWMKIFESVVFR